MQISKKAWESTMLGTRAIKFGVVVAATILMLAVGSAPSRAETGTVRFHVTKIGFIVGVGGGRGTLTYNGNVYRLRVGGIGIGTIGWQRQIWWEPHII
jgi:hypothetical protein